jgi:hypothetical protein
VTRAGALSALAAYLARSVPDIGIVLDLLEAAGGHARLVAAIRAHLGPRPAAVKGRPKPPLDLWLLGRVR